jgi:hypothetical protein
MVRDDSASSFSALGLLDGLSAEVKESLARCVADAFCIWSSFWADLDDLRGVQEWQSEYHKMFGKPLRLLGAQVVPSTPKVKKIQADERAIHARIANSLCQPSIELSP